MSATSSRSRSSRTYKPAAMHAKANAAPVVETPELPVTSSDPDSEHGAISRIAYSYWEARGFEAGSPEEDWLRAEAEYRATIL